VRALPLALLVALLLPLPVSARGPAHVEVDLATPIPPALLGDLDVEAPGGIVNLSAASLAGEPVDLSWVAGDAEVTRASWLGVAEPVEGGAYAQLPPDSQDAPLGPGRLLGIECGPSCRVVLAADEGTSVLLHGRLEGSVGRLERDLQVCPEVCAAQAFPSCIRACPEEGARGVVIPRGDFAFGGDAASLRDATLRASGRLTLLATDAVLVVEAQNGTRRLDVLTRSDVPASPLPGAGPRAYQNGYAWIVLAGARLETPVGTRALLYAHEPRVSLQGIVALDHAAGAVAVDGRSFDAHDARLLLEGSGEARLAPVATPSLLSGPPQSRLRFTGAATSVELDGAPLLVEDAGAAQDVARDATLAALLLAALLAAGRLLWAPLYTRLNAATVLRNPNRLRVYEVVCERRPATLRDLRAATGLARVVLQHHLRMLEVHGFVARRRQGSAYVYFAAEHAPPASDPAWALLADLTRRGVAVALARSPGPLTQVEIAAASGVSRRLASYHLRLLRHADLVREEPGLPHRYAPTPRLLALLETG